MILEISKRLIERDVQLSILVFANLNNNASGLRFISKIMLEILALGEMSCTRKSRQSKSTASAVNRPNEMDIASLNTF